MYQAITTKFLGPTNFRGSRIKATAAAGSVTVERDDSLSIEANHARAARMLAQKFGWEGEWHGGGLEEGNGYAFVVATGDARDGFTVTDNWNDAKPKVA